MKGRPEAADYVGLYTLDGDQVSHNVGEFELVPGDRIPAGEDANDVADTLVAAANRHGAAVTRADYLADDGSLHFAAIFADWASGTSLVEAWTEDAA